MEHLNFNDFSDLEITKFCTAEPDYMSRNEPELMAKHCPEWMADNRPKLMAKHRPEWMAEHRIT